MLICLERDEFNELYRNKMMSLEWTVQVIYAPINFCDKWIEKELLKENIDITSKDVYWTYTSYTEQERKSMVGDKFKSLDEVPYFFIECLYRI